MMPFEHDIGDSKPEIKTWKSIGELARKLVEKAAQK